MASSSRSTPAKCRWAAATADAAIHDHCALMAPPELKATEWDVSAHAAAAMAGPVALDQIRMGSTLRGLGHLEVAVGDLFDRDVAERQHLGALHKARGTVHIPHPGIAH